VPILRIIERNAVLCVLRWLIKFRHISKPYKIAWIFLVVSSAVTVMCWAYFGTDKCLPILADIIPILLAVAGIILSYIPPSKESHAFTTVILVIAAVAGTGVISSNRRLSELAHKQEIVGLNQKIDAVGSQNTKLSNFLLSANATGKITEADRRKGVETVLRNEYILSHNKIDPEILAGNRMPPDEWMNLRLKQLGERWTVENQRLVAPVVQAAQNGAEVVFSFYDDTVGPDNVISSVYSPIENGRIRVSVIAIVKGEAPAENVLIWLRVCKVCSWASTPPGFTSSPETPKDRGIEINEMLPNVRSARWDLEISVPPNLRGITPVFLGAYYGCKNCRSVDWRHPQNLWINQPNPFVVPKFQ